MNRKKGYFLIIVSSALYWYCQPIIKLNQGHPWDADVYYRMAEQVASNQPFFGAKPFIYRIGMPFVVGKLFPHNIMLGFSVVSAIFSVGIVVSIAKLLNRYISSFYIVFTLLCLLVINPNGPVRFYSFMPVFTDSSALFFITAIFALRAVEGASILVNAYILLLSIVGVCFREVVVIAPLSLLIESIYWQYILKRESKKSRSPWIFLSVIGGFGGIIVTHLMVKPIGLYTFSSHALYSIKLLIENLEIFLVALCVIYGPVFLILLLNPRRVFKIIAKYPYIGIYLLIVLGLAVVGGTHTDRFIFWAFPSVLLVLGLLVEERFFTGGYDAPFATPSGVGEDRLINFSGSIKPKKSNFLSIAFWMVLVISQLFAFRVFENLPNLDVDPLKNTEHSNITGIVLLSHYGDETNIAQIYAAYMGVEQRMVVLYQYIGLLIFFSLTMPKTNEPA